jgi:hypothetical protein
MIARVNSDNVTSKNGEGVRMPDLFGPQRMQKKEKVSECRSHSLIEDKSIGLFMSFVFNTPY